MSDRLFYTFVTIIILLIIAVSATAITLVFDPFALRGVESAAQQPQCETFSETGKTVCRKFLTYWRENGGLAQQGFPISDEFREVSEIDGREYTVQYFERAAFEHHPENAPPYDVLLSLLGTILIHEKYPDGLPPPAELPTSMKPEGSAVFPQTGKQVRGVFLNYWLERGGTRQYGYPISEAFVERSETDGREYIVQYFERAVFEFHPENHPPHDVLPALLGTLRFESKYPDGEPLLATPTPGLSLTPTP